MFRPTTIDPSIYFSSPCLHKEAYNIYRHRRYRSALWFRSTLIEIRRFDRPPHLERAIFQKKTVFDRLDGRHCSIATLTASSISSISSFFSSFQKSNDLFSISGFHKWILFTFISERWSWIWYESTHLKLLFPVHWMKVPKQHADLQNLRILGTRGPIEALLHIG